MITITISEAVFAFYLVCSKNLKILAESPFAK